MAENGNYTSVPLPSQEPKLKRYIHRFRRGNVETLFFNNATSAEESSRQAVRACEREDGEYIGRIIR